MNGLPQSWIEKIALHCEVSDIDFMCSAFSPELIDVVNPFAKAHKVASAEMLHVRMLQRLNEIGKPVFLSTGAHTADEVRRALDYLDKCDVTLMYCTASYPARYSNTINIALMKQWYGVPVGFSDHTLDVYEAPLNAVINGAVAIEKHVNFIGATGPDAPHSLDTEQFKEMVNYLKNGVSMNGVGVPTPDEADMVTTHNRRLIATQDILPGATFIEGVNFGIYRALKPTEAACPTMIDEINGKKCQHLIKAGDGVKIEHIHE